MIGINTACSLLGYSKQGYYKSLQRQVKVVLDEYLILELIDQKRKIWKKGSGRNLLASLQDDFKKHHIKIGRDKFFDLLRRNDLLVTRKSKKAMTTRSYHHFHKYPNIIKGIDPIRPNHIWVSDITYIWVEEGQCFVYLFLISDMYSRKIIGYNIREDLSAEGAIRSLAMAINHAGKANLADTIHHSDRGVQYCCHSYTEMLSAFGISISMTENGDPRENPIAERLIETIKYDFSDQGPLVLKTVKQAKELIKTIVKFYNQVRPHRSINMMTPAEAYQRTGKINRTWKNYQKLRTKEESNALEGEL